MTKLRESVVSSESIDWVTFNGPLNENAVLEALGLDSSIALAENITKLGDSVRGIEEELKRIAVSVGEVMSGSAKRPVGNLQLNERKNKDSKLSLILTALSRGDFEISSPQTSFQDVPAGNGLFVRHKLNFYFVKISGLRDLLQLPATCFETA